MIDNSCGGPQKNWTSVLIDQTIETMRLQFLTVAAVVGSTLAKQTPWLYKTEGKPAKMLEVGRLPALGCAFSHGFC